MNMRLNDVQVSQVVGNNSGGGSDVDVDAGVDGTTVYAGTGNDGTNLERRLLLDDAEELHEKEENQEREEDPLSDIQWEDLHGHLEHDAEFAKKISLRKQEERLQRRPHRHKPEYKRKELPQREGQKWEKPAARQKEQHHREFGKYKDRQKNLTQRNPHGEYAKGLLRNKTPNQKERNNGLYEKVKDTVQYFMPDMHTNDVFDGVHWSKAKFGGFDSNNDNGDTNVGEAKINAKTEANVNVNANLEAGEKGRDVGNDRNLPNRLEKLLKRPPAAIIDKLLEDDNVNVGEIFVTLPNFKDGARCAETLLSLYENARNPLQVYVGIVEQNHPTDTISCVEQYCYLQQEKEQKQKGGQNSNGNYNANGGEYHCPYRNQISVIQLSPWSAKGPSYARALAQRKLLGNQQFCMSIDAHSKLAEDWDDISMNQWKMVDNEFAVLSNQPARDLEKDLVVQKKQEAKEEEEAKKRKEASIRKERRQRKKEREEEDLFSLDSKDFERRIYRNCNILFNDYSIPFYFIHDKAPLAIQKKLKGRGPHRRTVPRRKLQEIYHKDFKHERPKRKEKPADSKERRPPKDFGVNGLVQDLSEPLLSYSWSPSFSFSKCHLDTNVPYDNFVTQFFDTESFTRYARMFTRGYDVYTPTINIVYHDYNSLTDVGKTMNNYISVSWEHSEMERNDSIDRVHTILGIHQEDPEIDHHYQKHQGNLGLYGVGKLRSLKQLEEFVDINLQQAEGHYTSHHLPTCSNLEWVPYSLQGQDTPLPRALLSVSPMDNLYIDNDDLDPQPVFPNRLVSRKTLSAYYNGHTHNFSPRGPTWWGNWNWNDLVIFSVLILLLIAMKKIIGDDYNNDVRNISSWFAGNERINRRGKDKKKL